MPSTATSPDSASIALVTWKRTLRCPMRSHSQVFAPPTQTSTPAPSNAVPHFFAARTLGAGKRAGNHGGLAFALRRIAGRAKAAFGRRPAGQGDRVVHVLAERRGGFVAHLGLEAAALAALDAVGAV